VLDPPIDAVDNDADAVAELSVAIPRGSVRVDGQGLTGKVGQ
jgi:hypothetical protein